MTIRYLSTLLIICLCAGSVAAEPPSPPPPPLDDYDSDCWFYDKTASPPQLIPVFSWTNIVITCPSLSVEDVNDTNCICMMAGVTKTGTAVAPPHDVSPGSSEWMAVPEKCAGSVQDEIGLSVKWKWSVAGGINANPSNGTGKTASFDYLVPTGGFSYQVEFTAIGSPTPEDTGCPAMSASDVVLFAVGEGVLPIEIPPLECPSPTYVSSCTGPKGLLCWGKLESTCTDRVFVEEICQKDCRKYRLNGQFDCKMKMSILKCIKVTGTNCADTIGYCKERHFHRKLATVDHELKHCAINCEFIDTFNQKVIDAPLFDSYIDCLEYLELSLRTEYDIAFRVMRERQKSHCPDFAGELLFHRDSCGNEKCSFKVRKCK